MAGPAKTAVGLADWADAAARAVALAAMVVRVVMVAAAAETGTLTVGERMVVAKEEVQREEGSAGMAAEDWAPWLAGMEAGKEPYLAGSAAAAARPA